MSIISDDGELVGDPGGVGLTRGEETGVGGGEFFRGIEAGAWSLPAQRESLRAGRFLEVSSSRTGVQSFKRVLKGSRAVKPGRVQEQQHKRKG